MNIYYLIIPVVAIVAGIFIFGVIANPPDRISPIIEPIENAPCSSMCYNISRNYNTNGYHPDFLKQPLVKTTCLDALRDGKTLGYCSDRLGTL